MNNPGDFVIENDVLVKYNGADAAVTVPEGVCRIGQESFLGCAGAAGMNRCPAPE